MNGPVPPLNGVLEVALYVEDVDRSARFYQDLFGFEPVHATPSFRALAVPGRQVLLLFQKGSARAQKKIPHDGSGELHVAFAIPAEALVEWESRLRARAIEIEEKTEWKRGGTSLYFRDPDRHLIELATPGLWTNY